MFTNVGGGAWPAARALLCYQSVANEEGRGGRGNSIRLSLAVQKGPLVLVATLESLPA